MNRVRMLGLVTTLIVALFLVSCGEKATPAAAPQASQETGAAAAPAPTTQPGAASVPQATAKVGGTFRRLWSDPPTLDPHLTSDTTSAGLVVEIFSGLVTITPDLKLAPDMAERWEISPDKKTYTFYLRKDAKFHDGKPVTARDFKFSFERAADPRLLSPVADTYLGDIVGVKDKLEGRTTEVRGVRVIDEQTLQITIDGPKTYFLAKLTYPTGFVVDREDVERRNWTSQPNGTGPFKVKEYRIGEILVLERNDLFYREKAKLDRVELILSGGSPMAMYENDEIHITGVGLADLDRVQNPSEPLNKDLRRSPPGFDITYIGFNVAVPPFDDPKVRQALNYAINKELLASQVLANLVIPAYGILPPGFPGYTGQVQGLKFDAETAKRLLAESKYGAKLPRIILTVPGTGGGLGLDLEVITEMWKQVLGVEVEIQQVEWATFLQDLNKKRLQMFSGLGWQADYPDPEDFLDVLFHSKSEINHGAYANPEADRLLEQARTEQDWNRRVDLYQQAEQLILNDAAWVPLWFSSEALVLVKPYVKGYELTPMIVPKLSTVWIDKP